MHEENTSHFFLPSLPEKSEKQPLQSFPSLSQSTGPQKVHRSHFHIVLLPMQSCSIVWHGGILLFAGSHDRMWLVVLDAIILGLAHGCTTFLQLTRAVDSWICWQAPQKRSLLRSSRIMARNILPCAGYSRKITMHLLILGHLHHIRGRKGWVNHYQWTSKTVDCCNVSTSMS